MWKLIARNNQNTKAVDYVLKDMKSGKIKTVAKNEFRSLVTDKRILDVQKVNGRLVGKGLRIENVRVEENPWCLCLRGEALDSYCKRIDKFKPRSEFEELCKPSDRTVKIISGLRRSGKTVMSLQLIRYLEKQGIKYSDMCYLLLASEVPFATLYAYLQTNCSKCKYVVIDEVTLCVGLANSITLLSDGVIGDIEKYVLTGTDSFAFSMMQNTTLRGRCDIVNTSVLSYYDFKNICGSRDYLTCLNLGEVTELNNYTDTRESLRLNICRNIADSVMRNKDLFKSWSEYLALRDVSEAVIFYYIVRILGNIMSLYDKFQSWDTGLAIRGIADKKVRYNLKQEAIKMVCTSLYGEQAAVFDNIPYNEDIATTLKRALLSLNILGTLENMYLLSGELYLTYVKIPAINMMMLKLYVNTLHALVYKAGGTLDITQINGHILESSVISNAAKLNKVIGYYRDIQGNCEVDLILRTPDKLLLCEIKNSSEPQKHFARHLYSELFLPDYAIQGVKETQRVVIYSGETLNLGSTKYINMYEFLLKLKDLNEGI